MRILLFALSLVSFVVYRAEQVQMNVRGTWTGSYRAADKITAVKVVFGRDNKLELYSDVMIKNGKTAGSYSVHNNNTITITCKGPDLAAICLTMKGRLNRNRDFVKGNWESVNNTAGSFSLSRSAAD